MDVEEWRDIAGFEGKYVVSNFGRVKSLPRRCQSRKGQTRAVSCKILKPAQSRGYALVMLCGGASPKLLRRSFYIHQLVLLAFVGQPPVGARGTHLDGNLDNNNLLNLCWSTYSENIQNAGWRSRHSVGSKAYNSKLTESIVRICREEYAKGEASSICLADRYGVSTQTMWKAINKKTWKHVE